MNDAMVLRLDCCHVSGPTVDGGIPSYVHCWGGIGRTGTVVGCWLVERGMGWQQAVTRIAELRSGTPDAGRRSPETDEQTAMVLGWARIGQGLGNADPDGR